MVLLQCMYSYYVPICFIINFMKTKNVNPLTEGKQDKIEAID